MYINKTTLVCNLTKDIELKTTASGLKVATINLATNRSWKSADGEKKEEVTYHNIKAFGKQAEVLAQYVHKGDQLYVEARMVNANYEKNGQKVYQNDFILESFQFGQKSSKNASVTSQNDRTDEYSQNMNLGTIANDLSGNDDDILSAIPFQPMQDRIIQIKTIFRTFALNIYEKARGSKIKHRLIKRDKWYNTGMPIYAKNN